MKPSILIEKFRKYLVQLGYSKTSVYMLPTLILEFLLYTKKTGKLEEITPQDIEKFMEYLDTRPLKKRQGILSDSTKNHYAQAIRKFFIWLEQSEKIEYNPLNHITFKHYKNGTREPLSPFEIQQLFEAAENLLEKSLLHLFYSCGLRRNEAVQLVITDIDFKKKLLYVREGKGCKRRVIPITGAAKRDFYDYLHKERRESGVREFIVGKMGKGINGDMLNRMVKQIGEKAGIDKKFSLHHLRHSIATHLLAKGLRVEYVQNFLGHKKLDSTQIYTKVKKGSMRDFI